MKTQYVLVLLFLGLWGCTGYNVEEMNDKCRQVLEELNILQNGVIMENIGEDEISNLAEEHFEAALMCISLFETSHQQASQEEQRDCGEAPAIENGELIESTRKATYGLYDEAVYKCKDGWTMSQSVDYAVCIQYRNKIQWTEPFPICTRTCRQVIDTLPNGRVDNIKSSGYNFPDKVNYTCNPGYETIDGQTYVEISCLVNGNWDKQPPRTCMREGHSGVACQRPPRISNGNPVNSQSSYPVDSVVVYECNQGYEFDEDGDRMRCLETGSWSTTPRCITERKKSNVQCEIPPHVRYAFANSDDSPHDVGTVIKYDCVPGYSFKTSLNSVTCLSTGDWSEPPVCLSDTVICEKPPLLPLTKIENARTIYYPDDVVSYSCLRNSESKGSARCKGDGEWTMIRVPSCTTQTCDQPPRFPGAVPSSNNNNNPSDTLVTYQCDGRVTIKVGSVICLANGDWETITTPECQSVLKCGIPPDYQDTEPIATKTEYDDGDTVEYACRNGKTLIDSRAVCQSNGQWRLSVRPDCEDKGCPPAAVLANMKRSHVLAKHPANDLVTYSCENADTLKKGVTICQSDGRWSRPLPADCAKGVQCEPVNLKNGEIKNMKPNYEIGESIEYECHRDYRSGVEPVCQETGRWSAEPVCTFDEPDITCEVPPRVQYANQVSPTKRTYQIDDVVEYKCEEGLEFPGDTASIRCQPNGQWTPRPMCIRIDAEVICASPGLIENGYLIEASKASYEIDSVVEYACNRGHQFSGSVNSIRCQENGQWSPRPQCVAAQPAVCDIPQSITNGRPNAPFMSSYAIGSVVEFVCNIGFVMTSSNKIVCQENLQWTTRPTCTPEPKTPVRKSCPSPPKISGGRPRYRTRGSYSVGSIVYYSCYSGYSFESLSYAKCLESSQWSPAPVCSSGNTGRRCRSPGGVLNGRAISRIYSSYSVGRTVSYQCNTGYTMSGSKTIRCESSGQWSAKPTCTRSSKSSSCGRPETISYGRTYSSSTRRSYPTNYRLRYICYRDYQMIGSAYAVCQPNGEWGSLPKCGKPCKEAPRISNAYGSSSSYSKVGNVVTYRCRSGYTFETSTTNVTCEASGHWSKDRPKCSKESTKSSGSSIKTPKSSSSSSKNSSEKSSSKEKSSSVSSEKTNTHSSKTYSPKLQRQDSSNGGDSS